MRLEHRMKLIEALQANHLTHQRDRETAKFNEKVSNSTRPNGPAYHHKLSFRSQTPIQ